MSLILDGTNGLSDVDGTAAAPAIRGTDTNTGIFFGADIIGFSEGGAEVARFNADAQFVAAAGTAALPVITTTGDVNTGIFFPAADTIAFAEGGVESMRIDSSGNLLVGTTSVDAAGSKVQLSSSGNRVFTVQNTANVNGDQALWVKLGSNCNNTSSPGFIYDTGGTNRLIIWGNGNVVNTNNSYGAISDIKLKENVVDATPKLDKLNQVRIVNYNMIGEEQKQLGVIAQELEQIFPSMVDESPDRDKEGNDLGTTTKSVKYSVFVPMLIKAIQEQQALIVSMRNELDALKTKVGA